MPLAKDLEDYLKSQIDYYVEEAASYKQIAEGYVPEIDSVTDTAFGIITGCTYLAFLQAFQTRGVSPSSDDVAEFNRIVKERSKEIRKALKGESTVKSN